MPPGAPAPSPRPYLCAAAVTLLLLGGCADDPPADPPVNESSAAPAVDGAAAQLAGLAAAAQDRRMTASYTWSAPGRADRTVTVIRATDGSWRVDVPAGALGGGADIALVRAGSGLFQCVLPSASRPEPAACVRLGGPDERIPGRLDPRVQHVFTDWLDVLTDRRAPLSVSVDRPLPGARGTCFSVESTSASLDAPLDVGIYCFDPDGTPTAVRAAFGSLLLVGTPTPAPATAPLAGPVVAGEPLGPDTPVGPVTPPTTGTP